MPVAMPTTVLSVASQIAAWEPGCFGSTGALGASVRARRLLFAMADLLDPDDRLPTVW